MRIALFMLSLCISAMTVAAPTRVETVGGQACKNGVHPDPSGPFAVYVFCDDALGTNIAVFYATLGGPRFEKWTLTRRFWQDQPWATDVHALGWVPKRSLLVVTTSEIYGEGAIYLLDLKAQTFIVLAKPEDCGAQILELTESFVTVGLNNCESATPYKRLTLEFPKSN